MDFSRLRHRIVFLSPCSSITNELGENVPVWIPYKPGINPDLRIDTDTEIYITADYTGNASLITVDGIPYAHPISLKEFEVWANVSPTTGREYEEAQKLRAETTYSITTRYFTDIKPDCKILFRGRILNIVSVLNVGEMNTELKIVAAEMITNAESF